ncbi:FKBP-type peptidyl-prolyl cis-trans isomerase [Novosphingobium humi]|uniref:Peptidyl-prolyl cis-trans isomerase n=1 Tax=Novosphingobium humi TaxID=2282397 RepID=A0ABY7TTD4_9SPHN|nr:FKBP-type peptidyl-prolyl cis-trans isomerase [Novosphingobium humi]WCT76477.1 FKBP-type peptidyl-prolyl cis-trans isomerase [Novosphingobium humi]WJT00021.1 FKBP-type peptidyl-prolyl cis-trans isomerase [Novosphingobium humi]
MTEITRVPLQPLSKGSVSKIWLGTLVAVLVGGTVAVAARPPLVGVKTLKAGEGSNPTMGDLVMVNYVGKLDNGTVFDQNKNVVMQMQGTIPGFAKALAQTQRGGKYLIHIPAKLAYGDHAAGAIPANSNLNFELEVIDFRNQAEVEMQRRMMERMMRAQGGAGAAPGGDAPAAPGGAE